MGKNKGSSKSQKRAESGKEAHTSAEHDGRKKRHRPKWFKRFLEAFACSRKQSNEVDNDAYVMSAPKKVEINDISSTRDSSYDNIPSSTKTEATITLTKTAEIHESPTRESQEVKSTNVPNQKKTQKRIDVEPKAPVIIKERAEECERNNCENVSSVKSRETEMGNYQRTTHASALIASTAQPLGLCEVDSASNTRRIPTEKSAEVKSLQVPVDPPVQRMRVHTQDDQLSSLTSQQQSSHQESVPKLKDKVPYNVQPENNPTSLSLSKVEEDRGGRQQELVPSETKRVNDHGERGVSSPVASTLQTPVEKVPAVTATEREIQSTKINKGKDTSKENAKNMRPVGLQNLGNTCFFNAVMQNLNQSFLLYEVLDKEGCRLSLTKSMLGFYKQMSSGTSYTVNPYQVLSDICKRSPRFAGGRQQDSHELLRHLLDGLRNEERESSVDPNNRKVLTRVDKVFGGHFMTVYTCSDCKMPYHVCEPLLDISLPISNEAFQTDEESSVDEEDGEVSLEDETGGDHVTYMYQKAAKSMMTPLAIGQKQEAQDDRIESISEAEVPQDAKKKKNRNKRKSRGKPNGQQSATKKCRTEGRSILDCLDVFTRTEHIADEYLCMACHAERVNQGATDYQMTSAKKRTLIYNPPALLTLHLKRFRQTDYGFTKCDDTISYPDMIDIAPYCSSWCLRNEGHETSIWYSLYGLVVHGGSLDGGHYVAYIKLRETEENIRQFLQQSYLDRDQLTKEELVRTLKQMHVLPTKPDQKEKWQPQPLKGRWFYISDSHCSEVSEDEVWRQQAYLLFYERRQGNAVPPNKSVLYQRFEGTSV